MSDETKNSIQSNPNAENDTRLNLLYEIGRILASLETMNEAAPQILEVICRNLQYELGELWCMDKQDKILRLENVWYLPSPPLENFVGKSRQFKFTKGKGLPGKVWAKGAPVLIENLSGENNLPRKFFTEETGLQSGFAFPILLGEKLLGVFSFFSRKLRQPDEAFLQMFAAVGSHIGQFIKREKIESSLRESEERYRIVAETASDAIIKINEHSTILFVNQAVERVFGYRVEEMLGQSLTMIMPENMRERHRAGLKRYLETGIRHLTWESMELPARHADGHIFPIEISFSEYHGDGKRFFIGVARDIAERKQTQERLRESEERFVKAFSASPLVMAISSLETGRLTDVNETFVKMTGFSREEAIGQTTVELGLWAKPQERAEEMETVRQIGQVRNAEYRFRTRSGEEIVGLLSAERIEIGDETFALTVIQNITTRKRAEEALLERERLARLNAEVSESLIENNSLSDILHSCTETIVKYLDAAFARIWTLNKEENVLELQASSGIYTHLDGEHSRIPVGKFKIGWIAAERKPHLTNSVIGDERVNHQEWAKREGMTAFAGYPLLVGDKLVGVAAMFARQPLTEQTLAALAAAANTIALGIERKQAEEVIRAANERFEIVAQATNDAIWDWNLQTDQLWWNDGVRTLFGYTPEQISPNIDWWYEHIHPADRERISRGIQQVIDTVGQEWSDEYRFINADGTFAEVSDRGFVIRDFQGKPVRMLGGMTDISERKRAEGFLQRYRLLSEKARDIVWVLRPDGQIVEVNQSAIDAYGYSREELLQMNIRDLREKSTLPQFDGHLKKALKGGMQFETVHRRKDGTTFPVEGNANSADFGGTRLIMSIVRDITTRKFAEQRIAGQNEVLEAVALGKPLEEILHLTTQTIERQLPGALCSVLLANESGTQLFNGSAQSLPAEYNAAIDGVTIGESVGSCGTAAFRRETVIVSDIQSDALWADFRDLAQTHDLRACWSQPIFSPAGKLYGTLAIYFRQPRSPLTEEFALLASAARIAGIAIERKFTEAELRDVRVRLEATLEAAEIGTWTWDILNDRVYADKNLARFFSVSAEAAAGGTIENYFSAMHPEDRERVAALVSQAVESGDYYETEYRLVQPDGAIRSVIARGRVERDREGKAVNLPGVILDITGRKLAEKAVRESEERLRLATEAAQMYSWEFDIQTQKGKMAKNAAPVLGISPDLMPRTLEESRMLVHPEDREASIKNSETAIQGTGIYHDEFRLLHPANGQIIWLEAQGTVVYDENEKPTRFVGVTQNITKRKQAEEKIRESEERFHNLADNISQLAWMADASGSIFWYNRRWFDFTGTTLEEMEGWGWQAVHHPDFVESVTKHFKESVAAGEEWEDTFPLRSKDGDYCWFLSRALPIWDEQGNIVRWFGTNTDVTEVKQIELEREQILRRETAAREFAEDTNRAKDEFIAVVSHELRSPLNAMLGWTRILQDKKPDEKTSEYALDVIVRNARSQSKLIEDLLDIARVGERKLRLEMNPTEIVPIINAALEIIKPAAEIKNIKINYFFDLTANYIAGDDDRLRQIFENLLSNAIKFTPEGGTVDVRLEREETEAKIIVSDTGQGISAEFLPQIFERFKQADPSTTRRHGGLGIGLSLARDLVELHGGTITAASAGESKGAIFIVSLPLRMVAPIRENTNVEREIMDEQGKLSGFWILAVDDEADAREIVSFMLQMNGAHVTTANSAVEALEILKNADGRLPDILLSDISMPNESGYALLEKIRALPQENGGQIPAVALTAFNRPEDRQSAFEAGFQKHLGKPVEMDDLIAAIIETAAKQ